MILDEIKREMMEDFGFSDDYVQKAFDTIYFIGIAQDLAWSKGQGILVEDIIADYDIIKYLIQGCVLKTTNKSTRPYREVYLLNENGEKIFQEILIQKRNENTQRFEEFKREFNFNDMKSLKIVNFRKKKIEDIDINDSYKVLFSNRDRGEKLNKIFYEKISLLKNLLRNYGVTIFITNYQSNKILGKREFILYEEFYQFLLDYTTDFTKKYEKILNEVNTKISFYNKLIGSIELPESRNKVQNDFNNYLNEYRKIIENLSQKNITTSYNSSKDPCFKIINEDVFKKVINDLTLEEIDNVTDPIIDEILFIETESLPQNHIKERKKSVKQEKVKSIISGGYKEDVIVGNSNLPKQWGILGKTNGVNVIIDLNAPHIIFVSGMMGSGKGYTIGVISEMLVSNTIKNISEVEKKSTIIVLYKPRDDVASEFWSIKYANDNEKEIEALKKYNATPLKITSEDQFKIFLDPIVYKKQIDNFVEEYQTDKISALQIDPTTLIPEDWANSLAIGGGSDALYIKEIFKILRHLDHPFSLNDIKNKINESNLEKRQKGLANSRLDILEEYFGPRDFIDDLIIGGVNIIDFRKSIYQPDDIFTIMTLIISKLQNKKELETEPFVFIVNEAHMYFKKGISKEFLSTVDNLIRRKRHGANWLLLDTQLPTDVDEKIISLSDIKIVHFTDKSVNVPILNTSLGEYKKDISKLKTGECVIMSNESSIGLSKPIKVNIRPRITKHGAETKKAI